MEPEAADNENKPHSRYLINCLAENQKLLIRVRALGAWVIFLLGNITLLLLFTLKKTRNWGGERRYRSTLQ